MTSIADDLGTLSVVVSAVLVPVIGLLTWTIRKFVTASIEHNSGLIKNQELLAKSLGRISDELSDRLERIELKLEIYHVGKEKRDDKN